MTACVTETQLRCPLCLDGYKRPHYIAECRHSFCESCIRAYVASSLGDDGQDQENVCPVCTEQFTGPQSYDDIENWLKTLYPDSQLMLLMREQNGEILQCEPCRRRDIEFDAFYACVDCEELLCDKCMSVHTSSRVSRLHTLLDVGNASDLSHVIIEMNKFSQKVDNDENSTGVFCTRHNYMACDDCVMCKPSSWELKSKSQEYSNLLSIEETVYKFKKGFLDFKEYRGELYRIIEKDLAEFTANVEAIMQDISSVRKDLNFRLDLYEKEFLEKANLIKTLKLSEVDDSISICDMVSAAADTDLAILEAMLNTNTLTSQNDLYCFSVNHMPEAYRSALMTKLPKITNANIEHIFSEEILAIGKDDLSVGKVSSFLKQIHISDLMPKVNLLENLQGAQIPYETSSFTYTPDVLKENVLDCCNSQDVDSPDLTLKTKNTCIQNYVDASNTDEYETDGKMSLACNVPCLEPDVIITPSRTLISTTKDTGKNGKNSQAKQKRPERSSLV